MSGTHNSIPADIINIGDKVTLLEGTHTRDVEVVAIKPCGPTLPNYTHYTLIGVGRNPSTFHSLRHWDNFDRQWQGSLYKLPEEGKRLNDDVDAMEKDCQDLKRLAEAAMEELAEREEREEVAASCAANNLNLGVNALKSHDIDHEQAGSLLNDLTAMIHTTNQAIATHNKEVTGASANKTSGKVVRAQRPGDGCKE